MRPDRNGFVLPTTLLVMTLLTVMLTAAFTLVSAEYRTTDNSAATTRAQALSEAGLQRYLSMSRALVGITWDSVRVTLPGGYTDVVARRLRASTTTRRAIWLIRASGYSADPLLIGQTQARRDVTQVVEYHPAQFPAEAALFAVNGVHILGNDPSQLIMNGTDGACGNARPRPGLVTFADPPGPALSGYSEEYIGDPDPLGSPPIVYAPDQLAVIDSTHIDWPALVGGNFTPDYAIPPNPPTWASQAVYLVNGDFTLGPFAPTMFGILVVTGNLTIFGDGHWHGMVIVGGFIKSTGPFRIHGMTISGMNISLGLSVPPDTLQRSTVDFHWRSCEFDAAIVNLAVTAPRRGVWTNTWSTY